MEATLREIREHIRTIVAFLPLIRDNPESSPQISYAIGAALMLFYVGVIYPLSFLPAAGAPNLEISWDVVSSSLFSFTGVLGLLPIPKTPA